MLVFNFSCERYFNGAFCFLPLSESAEPACDYRAFAWTISPAMRQGGRRASATSINLQLARIGQAFGAREHLPACGAVA